MKKSYVIIGIIILLLIIASNGLIRRKKLESNAVKAVCKVYEIKKIGRGLRTLDSKAVFFEYKVNGVRFTSYEDFYPNIKVGNCYEIIYSSESPKNVKVNFEKELDCSQY